MPYTVDPKVYINGVLYNDKAINGITATAGRNNVDEQPRAGYATINLVTANNAYPSIAIDQEVVIQVDNSSGTPVTLWTGWVSDVEVAVNTYGSAGWLNEQRITAVGTLTKLNRRIVGLAGYPKEFDGDRIAKILFETAGITWATYTPSTQTWAQVDPLLTWQEVDILIGDIDQPGDFELAAFPITPSSGLALAQQVAQSGLGILYETPTGAISYDDYTSRVDNVSTNGFLTLDANAILASNLRSITQLQNLINEMTIIYKNAQSTTASDASSIALYGKYAANLTTLLEKTVDAQQRASYYIDTRAYPRRELSSITLALHLDQVNNTLRNNLLPMTISKPIRITALPTSVYPDAFGGFVEGYSWNISRNELFLTLNLSEYGFSQLAMNWLQVPPTLAWQNVSATIEWQEARVVT
jgi:hypothetical protein